MLTYFWLRKVTSLLLVMRKSLTLVMPKRKIGPDLLKVSDLGTSLCATLMHTNHKAKVRSKAHNLNYIRVHPKQSPDEHQSQGSGEIKSS